MPGAVLRKFRSRDGRSLGRALAVLYLVAAVVAAFGNGASAAMATGHEAFCITAPEGKAPAETPVSGSHVQHCCLTGHAPAPAATPAASAALPGAAPAPRVPVETASDRPTLRRVASASPRGPPFGA